MTISQKVIKQRILHTLDTTRKEEHDTYVNLYDILPSIGATFTDLKRAAVTLRDANFIETTEISGKQHLLLAKITENGSAELKKIMTSEEKSWDNQVRHWIKASIMGTTIIAILAFVGVISVYSPIMDTQQFQAELGAVIEDLNEEEQIAMQTVLQYLYVQQGILSDDIEIELLISEINTKRFLVHCLNKSICKSENLLIGLIKENGGWIIDYEETLIAD